MTGSAARVLRSRLFPFCCSALAWVLGASAGPSDAGQLHDRTLAAKAAFQAVTAADVQRALAAVRAAMPAVERHLGTSRAEGARWKAHLLWNDQLRQVAGKQPVDLDFWRRVYRREALDSAGLEHPCFQKHRQAVRMLIWVAEAAGHPDLRGEFEQTLDALAKTLPQDDGRVSAKQAEAITQLLTRLYRRRQALQLVDAIRSNYAHPNFVTSVPAAMIRQMAAGDLDWTFKVNDMVGAASVRGQGRLQASRQVSLVTSQDKGMVRVGISGTSTSETVSREEGVRVTNRGVVRFVSRSTIVADATGLSVAPFATDAELTSQILSVSTPYRGRRDSEARQQAYARHETRRRQAERKAAGDLSGAFSREVAALLAPANERYQQEIRGPLLRFDRFPEKTRFRTDSSGLHVEWVLADACQLAAPEGPPPLGEDSHFKWALHQSAVNNTAEEVLRSRTESLSGTLRRFFPPAATPGSTEADPLYVTFAETDPLRASFDNGEVFIALAGAGYRYRNQRYSGLEILLRYRLERSGTSWELVQSGEPEVVPPKSPDGTRPKLGARDYSLRRILSNVLKRDLPARVRLDSFTLPPSLEVQGTVETHVALIRDGWFAFAATVRAAPTGARLPGRNRLSSADEPQRHQ